MKEIELGDKVRDKVSKFEGIALARMDSLFEATQFRVHRDSLNSNGEILGGIWIESGRLEVLDVPRVIGFNNLPAGKK